MTALSDDDFDLPEEAVSPPYDGQWAVSRLRPVTTIGEQLRAAVAMEQVARACGLGVLLEENLRAVELVQALRNQPDVAAGLRGPWYRANTISHGVPGYPEPE